MATILSISSQVVRGAVGNSAAVLALQRLGHEIWPLPTITLAHHRGHDRSVPALATPARFIGDTVRHLDRKGWLGQIDAVLVGYLAGAGQARAVAAAIARVRAARPGAIVMLDPVLGDDGALYVEEAVAEAVRDLLLPLADILTPNAFELGWLSGGPMAGAGDVVRRARGLGVPECVVTSAPGAPAAMVRTLVVAGDAAFACDIAKVRHPVRGTGDLLSALYLGHRLSGATPQAALARATGALEAVLLETARLGADELALVMAQDLLVAAGPAAITRL
jgi:pyridoxine kinase